MKTYLFKDLNSEQQQAAVDYFTARILDHVCSGLIRFNDKLNDDTLQADIDRALAKADEMQTPWFASEYVMETVGEQLISMAQCDAEGAVYVEGRLIVHLSDLKTA